jgi:hypothetical protein
MATGQHLAPPWLPALRRYAIASGVAHLSWEVLHFPLYTYWKSERWTSIAYDIVHCTVGDVMIALVALTVALLLFGDRRWPRHSFAGVAVVTLALGLGYTIYSEWLNVVVRKSWAYGPAMPIVPLLGTGLSPVVQWLAVPAFAFVLVRRDLAGDTSALDE